MPWSMAVCPLCHNWHSAGDCQRERMPPSPLRRWSQVSVHYVSRTSDRHAQAVTDVSNTYVNNTAMWCLGLEAVCGTLALTLLPWSLWTVSQLDMYHTLEVQYETGSVMSRCQRTVVTLRVSRGFEIWSKTECHCQSAHQIWSLHLYPLKRYKACPKI